MILSFPLLPVLTVKVHKYFNCFPLLIHQKNSLVENKNTDEEKQKPFPKTKLIAKRFLIQKRLGVGTFGRVYLASDIENKENFAIKIQKKIPDKRRMFLLQKEAEIIRDLSNEDGFPKLKIFFKENKRGFLVMSYLGENLSNLFLINQGRFSLKTVCMIAIQLLSRIETLHSKCYLHRDIKLENITIGANHNYKTLYLIDFGLSKSFLDEDGNHIKMKTDKGMVGTVRYSSIYTQQGFEQSRRDDLISIGYLLVYLLKEKLPWQKVKIDYNNSKEKDEKYKQILKIKKEITNESLCENLPKQFLCYMNYVKTLEFEEKPDYKSLKKMFEETLNKFNYENDLEFDWRKLYKIKEIHSNNEENKLNSLEKIKAMQSLENLNNFDKNIRYQDSRNTCNYAHWTNSLSNADSHLMRTLSKNDLNFSPHLTFSGGKMTLYYNVKQSSIQNHKGIDLNARKIFSEMPDLQTYKKEFNPSLGIFLNFSEFLRGFFLKDEVPISELYCKKINK